MQLIDSIDSTNRFILDQASMGAEEALAVCTYHQTHGRGRLNRRWDDQPKSSLLLSVLLRPDFTAENLHLLPNIAALSLLETIRARFGVRALLKWPNDVYLNGRKLAGILAESRSFGPSLAVAIGMGVNLNQPAKFFESAPFEGTSLSLETGTVVDNPVAILPGLLEDLWKRYQRLRSHEGRESQASLYRESCQTIGQVVRVELPDESFSGTAIGISTTGELLVSVENCVRSVSAGDIVHLRPTSI